MSRVDSSEVTGVPHKSLTVVMLLEATSQNRIPRKRHYFLKNGESILNFYIVYKYSCLKIMG